MYQSQQLALDGVGGRPEHPEPHERVFGRLRLQVRQAGLARRRRREQRLIVNIFNSGKTTIREAHELTACATFVLATQPNIETDWETISL